MPIHDWPRVSAGIFHDFHQGWTIEIRNRLNGGVLPDGYYAMADQRVSGPEPDVVALRLRGPEPKGGLVVAEIPPRIQRAARVESETALYARKANRIVIRHGAQGHAAHSGRDREGANLIARRSWSGNSGRLL